MSRKRAASPSHIDDFDDEFYENNCSSGNYLLEKLTDSSRSLIDCGKLAVEEVLAFRQKT